MQQKAITVIKDQYRKVSEVYSRKVEDMKATIARESRKTDGLERRRKLEMEGVTSDLQNMRRKVEFYQKYIGKLKDLVKEDEGPSHDMSDMYQQIKEEASEMEQSPEQRQRLAQESYLSQQQMLQPEAM